MRAYFAIKFYKDSSNKVKIETICGSLEKKGIEVIVMVRDFENWAQKSFSPNELMMLTFKEIDKSDFLVLDLSEKGVGLGIEAGYAFAKNIPIFTIAKKGSDISDTLRGISKKVFFYDTEDQLEEFEFS